MSVCYWRAECQYVTGGQNVNYVTGRRNVNMLLEGIRRSYNPLQAKILLRCTTGWFGTLVATFRGKKCRLYLQSTALIALKVETTVASIISSNIVNHNQHKLCEQFRP